MYCIPQCQVLAAEGEKAAVDEVVHSAVEESSVFGSSVLAAAVVATAKTPRKASIRRSSLPEILAAVAVSAFQISVGLAFAYSAVLIPQLEAKDSDVIVNRTQTAWLASLFVLVVPLGEVLAAIAMQRLGRLAAIRLALVPHSLGWALIACASSFSTILLGKVLCGISYSIGTSPGVVYITEVARPELRGALIGIGLILANVGSLLVCAKGALLGWRIVAALSALWVLLPLVLMWRWARESPVWLVEQGRIRDAVASLSYFAGEVDSDVTRASHTNELVQAQLEALQAAVEERRRKAEADSDTSVTRFFRLLLCRPTGLKPLILLITLFVFQQFSGTYIPMFYTVTFMQDVGCSMDEFHAAIIIGLIRIVAVPGTAAVRRLGRRALLLASSTAMALCLAISGYFSPGPGETAQSLASTPGAGWVPVVCIGLFVCTATIGVDLVPWTMTAEVFPANIRVGAQGIVLSLAHFIMFLALQTYRELTAAIGARGVQWLYALVALLNVLFVFTFLPETHNRTLTEIEDYFERHTVYPGHKAHEPGHANRLQRQAGRRHRYPSQPSQTTKNVESFPKIATILGEDETENTDRKV